jgi:transaldolase
MNNDESRFNDQASALSWGCRFPERMRLHHIFGRRTATTEQPMNPLLELLNHKQAVWLDYIRRDLIVSGGLRALIDRDGLRGVTSNPTIFEKAIDGSTDYDGGIAEALARNPRATAKELYDALVIEDVRHATDILRPRYDESGGTDGFVSIEPPPQLTRDSAGTIAEAQRLWRTVDRPNLLIKVVATAEGVAAVEVLIAAGINVNITLMFSLRHYEAVAAAYIRGIERCQRPERVASVASFFVSRVDTQVDRSLDAIGSGDAYALRGKIAIANAKIVYRRFREIFYGDPFQAQRQRGARVQRPLWASTSTKNPHYRDVLYVEELVGPDTVNTIPLQTLDAFRDHGHVRGDTVMEAVGESQAALSTLARLGIDLDAITDRLQVDGISAFAADYDRVLAALEKKKVSIATAGSGGGHSG